MEALPPGLTDRLHATWKLFPCPDRENSYNMEALLLFLTNRPHTSVKLFHLS
jgi:hypothetical protein